MSEKTRVAVAGLGLVGRRHAEVIRRAPDMILSAIVETNPEGQAIAAELDVPVFESLSEMLASSAPDGVVLATPTPCHLEQGLTCIAAGSPVLIEKPIAVTSE